MMLLIPGRKCWVLVDNWEKCAVAEGKVVAVCGGLLGSGALVEMKGAAGLEHISANGIWATRRGAERAARRYNKNRRRAGVL